ncbi:MAG: DNA mismatch repair protein MutL [Bacteroidetes bacterium]|nr:MAG: DNA mismatch repair protein MutL [Bacteroidota bacterium]
MADSIIQLSNHVANQIAAGEVVTRPASVVKELIENAVDAGALNITVLVKDAGRTLIQVIDDGKGMSEEDARMCFSRHATSKIASADDLLALVTKGFRGEALSSISAISQVELKTREQGSEMGVKVQISGEDFKENEHIAHSVGSSFAVKNLFYNVPARRKFLKSDQVELRHIVDEFQRVAMAHHSISFRLNSNGSDLFNLKPGPLRKRVVAIFGAKYDERLVPVDEETDVVKISGFVGKPAFSRRTRGEQFLFVNGRFIKHPLMHRAIMNAYEGVLAAGNFPLYTIFLEVDPSKIDVNIHPTKVEAKFEEDQIIFAMLRSAIKRGLGKHNVAPSLNFEQELSISIPLITDGAIISEPKVTVNSNYNPFDTSNSNIYRSKQVSKESPSFSGFEKNSDKELEEIYGMLDSKVSEPVQSLGDLAGDLELKSEKIFHINKRFIATVRSENLVVIDVKRAHERILYEGYLRAGIGGGTIVSQRLLFPEPINLSKADTNLLLDASDILKLFGLELSESDSGEVEVLSVPSGLAGRLQDCLDSVLTALQDGTWSDEEGKREKLAQVWAETGAVSRNGVMSEEEMVDLVNRLFSCELPSVDSSGRASYTVFSSNFIETKFK